jgi:hypothetical protein
MMLARILVGLAAALGLAGCATDAPTPATTSAATPDAPAAPAEPAAPMPTGMAGGRTWSFEPDTAGSEPADFTFARTGGGPPGTWVVRAISDAPDGRHVLVQSSADRTDFRFPMAVANTADIANLRLSVRGRPVSGEIDQAFGLVFRYRDADNYYIARANALEDNVRLYHVTNGVQQQIGSWRGTVAPGTWHSLSIEAHADHLVVSFDGAVVIDLHDSTPMGPGRVGLWTKADAVTQFDLLSVEPLAR